MLVKIVAAIILFGLVFFASFYNVLNYESYKRWQSMRADNDEPGWTENEKWLIDHIAASNAAGDDSSNEGEYMKPKRFPKVRAFLKRIVDKGMKDWKGFKAKHRKTFKNAEKERQRMLAFINAERYAVLQNEAFEHHNSSYKVEINDLADLSFTEYRKLSGFRYIESRARRSVPESWESPENVEEPIPDSIDWRELGYVTNVKNQKNCGSCWAFSVVGAVEGQYKRNSGNLVAFSEQQLVDCSSKNYGCDGGYINKAFQYIIDNGGINSEEYYPYKGIQNVCPFRRAEIRAVVSDYVDIPKGDEEALKRAVATKGPVSVAIDVDHLGFMLYKEGVFYDSKCKSSPRDLEHAVLVVGYGTDSEFGDYWIVKNSWGTDWGSDGYIKMARNRNNHCGIATAASYPVIV